MLRRSAKLMQIVLTGQPELIRKLASPQLRQLRQRIAIEHHMEALTPEQVQPYLAHRIEVAGGRYEEIFAPGVEQVFYWFSQGCPRLISLLAVRRPRRSASPFHPPARRTGKRVAIVAEDAAGNDIERCVGRRRQRRGPDVRSESERIAAAAIGPHASGAWCAVV